MLRKWRGNRWKKLTKKEGIFAEKRKKKEREKKLPTPPSARVQPSRKIRVFRKE